MGEAPEDKRGRERYDWDIASCGNLFNALKLSLTVDSVKFCRRLGEGGGGQPRPLLVGFHDETDRNRLLRADTRNTRFSNVETGPDLTKKQRQEEANMREEAIRRNRELPSADREKNLAWTVVGHRGDKRLVKKYINPEAERPRNQRRPPPMQHRISTTGSAEERAAALQATRNIAGTAATVASNVEGEPEEVVMEEATNVEGGPVTGRKRINSKRKGGPLEDDLPPAKH